MKHLESGESGDMGPPSQQDHSQRDSVALRVIGSFFAFFAILVLLGTFWEHRAHAIVVNIVAGLVLLLIGVGMAVYGYYLGRRNK